MLHSPMPCNTVGQSIITFWFGYHAIACSAKEFATHSHCDDGVGTCADWLDFLQYSVQTSAGLALERDDVRTSQTQIQQDGEDGAASHFAREGRSSSATHCMQKEISCSKGVAGTEEWGTWKRMEDHILCNTLNSTSCTAPVPFCSRNFQSAGRLALSEDDTYRVSDLIRNWGQPVELKVRILADPGYRGTLMRDHLSRRAHVKKTLASTAAEDLESELQRLLQGGMHACNLQIQNKSCEVSSNCDVWFFSQPQDEILELATAIEERLAQGRCEAPGRDDIVVQLRLGDSHPEFSEVVENVDAYMMQLGAKKAKRIVINGILHVGVKSEKGVAASAALVDDLIEHYSHAGFNVSLRSNPDADADLCYLMSAPHLVTGCSKCNGFMSMIEDLRNKYFQSLA